MNKKLLFVVSMLFVLSAILVACQPQTVVETVEVKETVVVEKQVVVTATTAPPVCEPAVAPPVVLTPGKLIMSINATIPPVQFIDENGNLVGMRVELGEEIARRLCLEPEWVNIQFDAMIPGLTGGRFDMINTGLFFTEERAFDLGMELIPYELQAIAVSVPKGNPKGVKTTDDLAGLVVGVEQAGYEERQIKAIDNDFLTAKLEAMGKPVDLKGETDATKVRQIITDAAKKEGIVGMDIRTFPTFADAFNALQAGQLDAVVSVDATGKYYQDRGDFDRALSGLKGSPATLAFAKTELAEAVAGVMNEMLADGFYDQLFEKWGVTKIMEWKNDVRAKGTYGWDGKFKVY